MIQSHFLFPYNRDTNNIL
uniref:Uncharacterized protein n=1 Tax=Anguilla anguilla TaxID=7936 RepID=A0A0E9SF34_ANGAN